MHPQLIQRIVEELRLNLIGRYLGKIFQLSQVSFALDFGLRGSFLFISVEPSNPRLYLIQRRARELEKQSVSPGVFGQLLRAKAGGGHVVSIDKDPLDRIVRLTFRVDDETGTHFHRIVAQLTGRAANLFLLDELNRIEAVAREHQSRIHELYQPPPPREIETSEQPPQVTGSPSAFADAHYTALDSAREFHSRASAVRAKLLRAIRQQRKLKENLQRDLVEHGDPEAHKRIGDLLLSNIATAERRGNKVVIIDYYAEDAPSIELEIDEHISLTDEAAQRFRQYGKAKRARAEIAARLTQIDREIARVEAQLQELERIIQQRDEEGLAAFGGAKAVASPSRRRPGKSPTITGVRRYLSSDGYEVLVGRAARDNDNLTFKVAQPNDLWLHAGDYPGSHVVVRNPTRKEIPQRTIIEAAQLAGRFSQASEDAKVVIHYTERKFLSKPKGAAPGLVRLSRFRSITVEPKENIPRISA